MKFPTAAESFTNAVQIRGLRIEKQLVELIELIEAEVCGGNLCLNYNENIYNENIIKLRENGYKVNINSDDECANITWNIQNKYIREDKCKFGFLK